MAESDLPEEVMMDILRWLPVKSLIRFTSVSKRWRFIILSDPQFAQSQFDAARQRKTLGCRLILFSTNAPQLESLHLADTPSFGHPSSVRKLSPPLDHPRDLFDLFFNVSCDIRLLGCCNGLVSVAIDDMEFCMWNPATGFFKKLPEPGFSASYDLKFHGAGYLSATDDYRILAHYDDVTHYIEEVKMFSSRAHVWKTIQPLPDDYASGLPRRGTLLNEALHWVRQQILVFDFAREEFRTMRLPQEERDIAFSYAGVSEGCLCVCGYVGAVHGSVDFWVMREYGVEDSWTKLFNFSYAPAYTHRDFLVMEGCTVAVKNVSNIRSLLVEIDHKKREGNWHVHASRQDRGGMSMIPYEESLIQINH